MDTLIYKEESTVENKMHPLNEGELEMISGGAKNDDDLPPIQCPNCRDVAIFNHVSYVCFTQGVNEFYCAMGCHKYIYVDQKTGAVKEIRDQPYSL